MRECKEEDWANAWKAFYGIQRMGKQIVIKPSWLEYKPEEGDIVLDLDPGMAFGTGLHPTTRLCLAALEEQVQPGIEHPRPGHRLRHTGDCRRQSWAGRMCECGHRHRYVAVEATRQNVERNGLSTQIRVEQGSAEAAKADAPYDLIVANILASVIIELSKSLYGLLKPGGTLISSGIFIERGDAVIEALERAGLPVREKKREGDWLCLISVREQ